MSAILALAGLGLTYWVAHKQDVEKEARADERSSMLIGTAMGFYNVALDGMMPLDEQKQVFSLPLTAADRRAILAEIKARQFRTAAWADGHMQSLKFEDASPRYQASLRILQNLVQVQSDQVSDAIRILSDPSDMDKADVDAALAGSQETLDYALREVRLMIDHGDERTQGELEIQSCGAPEFKKECSVELNLYRARLAD